jgi:hypothetical protein
VNWVPGIGWPIDPDEKGVPYEKWRIDNLDRMIAAATRKSEANHLEAEREAKMKARQSQNEKTKRFASLFD